MKRIFYRQPTSLHVQGCGQWTSEVCIWRLGLHGHDEGWLTSSLKHATHDFSRFVHCLFSFKAFTQSADNDLGVGIEASPTSNPMSWMPLIIKPTYKMGKDVVYTPLERLLTTMLPFNKKNPPRHYTISW